MNPIPLNDFARQWADTAEDVVASVRAVGESGWYILGGRVAAFEKSLAREVGRRFVIGCASGLDAIEIGLRVLGHQAGQRVLTTPLSAYATTLAITRAGGEPVFVDVDESGLIDLDLAEAALSEDDTIRFMVPVHLFGHALDLDRLEILQRRFGLKVIEDSCQAVGAQSRGRFVGAVGDVSALSFYPTKNLGALGDGGAVLTDDEGLDRACRHLRDYGQTAKYVHDVPGLNSRLDELHAAILADAFLPRLADWTNRRRAVARAYLAQIRSKFVTPLPVPAGSESVWHLFPVTVDGGSRDAFMAHLKSKGVSSGIHYPKLISDQGALRGLPFEVRGDLRRARNLAAGEVSLPIHPYLTDAEVDKVIDAVNSWQGP